MPEPITLFLVLLTEFVKNADGKGCCGFEKNFDDGF